MIPFKGRWGIKQYMKDKPHKWDIKSYVLADASTGYVSNFFIYSGKSLDGDATEGLCTKAVLDLVGSCYNKGQILYVDNYYTSPRLFEILYYNDIYATGTARANRANYPVEMKKSKHPVPRRAERGYYRHLSRGPMTAGIWFDRRYVNFLFTASTPAVQPGEAQPTTERRDGARKVDILCPPYLSDYVSYMRGVDRGDQLIALYGVGRKSRKPWKRIFYYLLECAILNAYIIESFSDPNHETSGRGKRDLKDFETELASMLIDGFVGRGRRLDLDASHLMQKSTLPHFPVPSPDGKSRRCKVCAIKGGRSESIVFCDVCKVHLCTATAQRKCFYLFYTVEDL